MCTPVITIFNVCVLIPCTYSASLPYRNIEDKILQINPILEAFGNSPSPLNDNSSRFAKIVELSYSKVGKITGAKIFVFLLEHSRVMNGEDNFHIFRYILAGLKSENKLPELLPPGISAEDIEEEALATETKDAEEYSKLKHSFTLIGLRPADLDLINGILLAIHLSKKIDFVSCLSVTDNIEGSKVKDTELLKVVAHLLGVDHVDLGTCWATSHISTRGELIKKSNSILESRAVRNAMCKGLFTRLFDYVVQMINKLLSYSLHVYGESATIGVLDIFGFEKLDGHNSFEQLCINSANEQMFYFFHQYIFCWEKEEYLNEEISVDMPEMPSNKEVLEMVLSRPIGALSLLDEESKFPSANDNTLLSKLHTNLSKYSVYLQPKTETPQFTIRHFADNVTYDTNGFIEKNRNFMPPELITLFRDSRHEVLQFMFNTPFTRTGRLNSNEISSSESSGGNKQLETIIHSQTRAQQTLATQFRHSLSELIKILLNGAPHFIRCFKPNQTMSPVFDKDYIAKQLRYTGILQIVNARQTGFSYQLTFAEFLRRYCFLGFTFDERVLATRENCQLLLLRLRMDGYALGKTKVFLKYYHIEYLSKQYEYQIRKIIRVQAVVRRWLATLKCQKEKWSVARRVFLMRMFATRWKIRAKLKSAVTSRRISLPDTSTARRPSATITDHLEPEPIGVPRKVS